MSLLIVDYIGYCDEFGKPIGHTIKTISEALENIVKSKDVCLIIPKCYESYFDKQKVKLLHNIDTRELIYENKLNKIKHIIKKIILIKNILKNNDNIWFVNTDFWVFFTLALYRCNRDNIKKIYITNYIDYCDKENKKNKIRSFFYRISSKKVKNIFTTNKKIYCDNEIYITDYIYDEEKYKKFLNNKKIDAVLFAGTINQAKDVRGLVEAFNKNGERLIINGRFDTKELYEEIVNIADNNIEIFNKYLSYDEYYNLLATYKFIILPYKEDCYKNRSSGVVLETIFLNSIPIIPQFMSEGLDIKGIKYQTIEELKNFKIENFKSEYIQEILKYNEIKKENCDINTIRSIYEKAFEIR